MLNNHKKSGEKDCYNIIPTLLYMGKSSERHIVRAIDNLCSNCKYYNFEGVEPNLIIYIVPSKSSTEVFDDARGYIETILEDESKDADVYKRAKSIMARLQLGEQQVDDSNEESNTAS